MLSIRNASLSRIVALGGAFVLSAFNVLFVDVGASHADGPECYGWEVGEVTTIVGTAGPDVLIGTRDSEVIFGLGGEDVIDGRGRGDSVCGGIGNDHLVVGRGDHASGGRGDDVLKATDAGGGIGEGDSGIDTYIGGPGEDTFYDFYGGTRDLAHGYRGNDAIDLGRGDDATFGGAGADYIYGNPGQDRVNGGKGRDTYNAGYGSTDGVTVNLRFGTASGGGLGRDRLVSVANVDGSDYADVLIGEGHRNVIFAGPGDDQMTGGRGDDDLYGHDGNDQADGGPGTDTCNAEMRSRCEP